MANCAKCGGIVEYTYVHCDMCGYPIGPASPVLRQKKTIQEMLEDANKVWEENLTIQIKGTLGTTPADQG